MAVEWFEVKTWRLSALQLLACVCTCARVRVWMRPFLCFWSLEEFVSGYFLNLWADVIVCVCECAWAPAGITDYRCPKKRGADRSGCWCRVARHHHQETGQPHTLTPKMWTVLSWSNSCQRRWQSLAFSWQHKLDRRWNKTCKCRALLLSPLHFACTLAPCPPNIIPHWWRQQLPAGPPLELQGCIHLVVVMHHLVETKSHHLLYHMWGWKERFGQVLCRRTWEITHPIVGLDVSDDNLLTWFNNRIHHLLLCQVSLWLTELTKYVSFKKDSREMMWDKDRPPRERCVRNHQALQWKEKKWHLWSDTAV